MIPRLSLFAKLVVGFCLIAPVVGFAKAKVFAPGSGDIFFEEKNRLPMVPVPMDWRLFDEGELDLRFLNNGPAGGDGFVSIKDGHYVTESGKRLKFWGVNLTAGSCFPEKKDAAEVAEFYARIGINAVRLHFLDSAWGEDTSLFTDAQKTTREFDPDMLDRLDFFIAELKKQGIYSNINLLVGREFREEDGVPYWDLIGRAKPITLFDGRLIELQYEHARTLLTHVNPYTGNAYVNEPAIALVELVNENSLIEAWRGNRTLGENTQKAGNWDDIHPHYGEKLTQMYNSWLGENVSQKDISSIREEADVGTDTQIPRLKPSEFKSASELRFRSEAEFTIETERKFHLQYYDFLKKELGLKSLVVGNSDHNHAPWRMAQLEIMAELDGTDGHVYWQHPKYKTYEDRPSEFSIGNSPMVNEPLKSTVVDLSGSAVTGMPYSVSETNHPYPSDFAAEGVPIISAYGNLQDWDAVYFYTMEHVQPGQWDTPEKKFRYFDFYGCPLRIANLAIGAVMFRRSDVAASDSIIERSYAHEEVVEGIRAPMELNKPFYTAGFERVTPLIHQTRIDSFDQPSGEYPAFDVFSPIVSDTGELKWYYGDLRGRVVVDTLKAQALVGFVGEGKESTQNLKVKFRNKFAAVQVTSLDDHAIAEAKKLLITATTRMGLTGMKWSEDRKSLTEFGEKPATIELIEGEIRVVNLKAFKQAEIRFLDGSGNIIQRKSFQRGEAISLKMDGIPSVWMTVELVR